ncbi:MAG: TetR/AcrR family transcriptional regulator [Ktedonobacterales bacterium]|nr:TetR/AcrR family transcriptional regulator [Ktedonobacterales bacterium]
MANPSAAAEERRRQIMEAALPVFAEKGFKGATNRDIAEKAGIAPGLIYHYFKNKEDLFSAILDEFLPVSRVALPLESMTSVPPAQLLPLLVHGLSGIMQEGHFFLVMRILVAETMHAPESGRRVNAVFKALVDPFTAYLRVQIAQGRLRAADPLLMAQSFFASIGLFYLRRSIGLDETLLGYDATQLATFLTEAFLRAYAPDPTPS